MICIYLIILNNVKFLNKQLLNHLLNTILEYSIYTVIEVTIIILLIFINFKGSFL